MQGRLRCSNKADPGDFPFAQLVIPESDALRQWTELTEMPADSTDLEAVISYSSVSCLINMEPLELLCLQPSEPIASESVGSR